MAQRTRGITSIRTLIMFPLYLDQMGIFCNYEEHWMVMTGGSASCSSLQSSGGSGTGISNYCILLISESPDGWEASGLSEMPAQNCFCRNVVDLIWNIGVPCCEQWTVELNNKQQNNGGCKAQRRVLLKSAPGLLSVWAAFPFWILGWRDTWDMWKSETKTCLCGWTEPTQCHWNNKWNNIKHRWLWFIILSCFCGILWKQKATVCLLGYKAAESEIIYLQGIWWDYAKWIWLHILSLARTNRRMLVLELFAWPIYFHYFSPRSLLGQMIKGPNVHLNLKLQSFNYLVLHKFKQQTSKESLYEKQKW